MYLPVFQLEHSNLNLIVASTENNIVMVEGVAREVAEDILCDAVLFAHQEVQYTYRVAMLFAGQYFCNDSPTY
jgi:polyribonucleotide nucleotidyltransferase